MIIGMHAMLYSKDADAARRFLGDALGLRSIDAGEGWLIFALPPAEMGVHPTDDEQGPGLYFLCDDIQGTVTHLKSRGVEVTRPIEDQGWGVVTTLRIPGGGEIGLYEPRHPTALELGHSPPGR